MDLEQACLEAIKQKLVDTFKKVTVSAAIEGREVVFRISIPSEIMVESAYRAPAYGVVKQEGMDREATAAMKELLGEDT